MYIMKLIIVCIETNALFSHITVGKRSIRVLLTKFFAYYSHIIDSDFNNIKIDVPRNTKQAYEWVEGLDLFTISTMVDDLQKNQGMTKDTLCMFPEFRL